MATIVGNGAKGHHQFTLNVWESYTSGGAENYSNVDFTFTISPIQKSWDWSGWGSSISYSINIEGNVYTGTIPSYNGSSTVTLKAVGGIRINHNGDGSKSIGFSFSVNDGAKKSYTCGNASASGSMTLSHIPRYANFTGHSISGVSENAVTVYWNADSTCDWLQYSLNGGGWTDTAGHPYYTISGLSANTGYNIRTRIRRQDSQLWTESGTLYFTTYNYPYCTSSPNFTIGNAVKLDFYNPLNRNITVKLIGNNNAVIGGWSGTGSSVQGFNDTDTANSQYGSIPNATSSRYKVQVTYNGVTKTRDNGNTYSINVANCIPTFSNFTYKDINSVVTNITGNDQILVKGLSNLQVTIPSADKMVTKNGASGNKYIATIDTLNKSINYSNNDINLEVGTVINNGTKRLTVSAYDSRNVSNAVYKDITVYDYNKPVINASIKRLNNFENETTIKVNGTFTKLTIDGEDKNTVTSVQYRYRETDGTWSSWTNLSTTITSGKFTCSDVILSLDNTKSFDFEIKTDDKLETNIITVKVDIGKAIFFISTNKRACYINGELINLGYREPAILVNGDYNTMCSLDSGFYKSTSTTNAPYTQAGQDASSNWFFIIHIAHSENYQMQIASPFFEDGLYFRHSIVGTWSKWKKISYTEVS